MRREARRLRGSERCEARQDRGRTEYSVLNRAHLVPLKSRAPRAGRGSTACCPRGSVTSLSAQALEEGEELRVAVVGRFGAHGGIRNPNTPDLAFCIVVDPGHFPERPIKDALFGMALGDDLMELFPEARDLLRVDLTGNRRTGVTAFLRSSHRQGGEAGLVGLRASFGEAEGQGGASDGVGRHGMDMPIRVGCVNLKENINRFERPPAKP